MNKKSAKWCEIDAYTDFLPKTASKSQRLYHFQNQVKEIPKCKFTGDDCHYTSQHGYTDVSKDLWTKLIQYDNRIKIPSFRWRHFLQIGANIDELLSLQRRKYFYKIRENFTLCIVENDFKVRLEQMGFLPHVSSRLTKNLCLNNWESIKDFVRLYYDLTAGIRNNSCEFYEIRGHSVPEATQKKYDHCNAWPKLKEKLEQDPALREQWSLSRLPGLLSQNRISKTEKMIVQTLQLTQQVQSQVVVRLDLQQKLAKYMKNRYRLCLDAVINGNIAFEYNGSYWHRDWITFPDIFTEKQYVEEIMKFKYLVDVEHMRAFVVWEKDVKSSQEAIELFDKFLLVDDPFGSSRDIDVTIFNSL